MCLIYFGQNLWSTLVTQWLTSTYSQNTHDQHLAAVASVSDTTAVILIMLIYEWTFERVETPFFILCKSVSCDPIVFKKTQNIDSGTVKTSQKIVHCLRCCVKWSETGFRQKRWNTPRLFFHCRVTQVSFAKKLLEKHKHRGDLVLKWKTRREKQNRPGRKIHPTQTRPPLTHPHTACRILRKRTDRRSHSLKPMKHILYNPLNIESTTNTSVSQKKS